MENYVGTKTSHELTIKFNDLYLRHEVFNESWNYARNIPTGVLH